MVTHSSTSRPVQCLCMAERTGCPVLTDLWSYVLLIEECIVKICCQKPIEGGRAELVEVERSVALPSPKRSYVRRLLAEENVDNLEQDRTPSSGVRWRSFTCLFQDRVL